MKRFVLLLAVAALFVCLLAAPAADAQGQANRQTYRPPVDASMVWGPSWFEYSGATGTFADVTWHQASDPVDPEYPDWAAIYQPIPIENDTYFWSEWVGVTYGFMYNVPNSLLVTVDVTGPGGFAQHFGTSEAKAYWSGPYVADQFWADFWLDNYGFTGRNKDLGALLYGQDLMLPIGPFPAEGRYDVHVSWVSGRPLNELVWHGDRRHSPAGAFAYDYTFSIDVE